MSHYKRESRGKSRGPKSQRYKMSRARDISDSGSVINILDGASPGTIVNSKAVAYGSSGEVNATTLQLSGVDLQTQLDAKASTGKAIAMAIVFGG